MSEAGELLDQLMIEQKARIKAIAQITDLTNERTELKARVKELEDKFERVNAFRTFALIKFGDEVVTRRVDGDTRFVTLKYVDREIMEKGDE